MQHFMLFTDYRAEHMHDASWIKAQCSCSAWFEMMVRDDGFMLALVRFAGEAPLPCPAVDGVSRSFEKELKAYA